jgi:hypothetical protein
MTYLYLKKDFMSGGCTLFNPYSSKNFKKPDKRDTGIAKNKKYDSDLFDKKQIDDLEYGDAREGLPVEAVPKGHIEKLEKIQKQMGVSQCLMMGGSSRMSHIGAIQVHDKEKYNRQKNIDKINKKEPEQE